MDGAPVANQSQHQQDDRNYEQPSGFHCVRAMPMVDLLRRLMGRGTGHAAIVTPYTSRGSVKCKDSYPIMATVSRC